MPQRTEHRVGRARQLRREYAQLHEASKLLREESKLLKEDARLLRQDRDNSEPGSDLKPHLPSDDPDEIIS